ncbi:acyl--CoA ligase [Ectothiorhodospiraceae bacterium WFHF3C12]|nr:acyl--CoA ligase [Ectothiorhodospiraceae bacterium WFHF3C12]
MQWPDDGRFAKRTEAHFRDRVVTCFRDRPASVDELFRDALTANPEGDAVVHAGGRLTYRELETRVERVAANLAAHGLNPGDRVALLIGNEPEFVIGVLAAARLGAVAVPLTIREQAEGLGYILGNCEARALLFEARLADRLPAFESLPRLQHRFAVGGECPAAWRFETLLSEAAAGVHGARVDEEETAVILYTSGTTGRPKGAMLTHLNIVHSVMHLEQALALRTGERSVLAVPASHVTGLVAIILSMVRVAGCTVLMREFDARVFNRLASEERVSHTVMVPAMYNLCLMRADFESHDLSQWRIGAFGGAPMPEATIQRLREKLPNLELMNAYGATETTSPTTIMPARFTDDHLDSVGQVVDCGDVRVMDDSGREVPHGEAGEIWIAGPMVVPGYWNNPEATADSFAGGYWRSGDIGSKDADGFVRVFDRKKDMINRGGYKVFSAEVESVLAHHPAVVESAVVARPDPVLGEKVHAFVMVSEPGTDPEQIRAYCRQHLADYQVPDYLTLQEAPLPRNANGKVIKRDLRLQAAEETKDG